MTFCFGLLAGIGMPFVEDLSTPFMIMLLLVFASAGFSIFFLRETKDELDLRNLYSDIYPEEYLMVPSPGKKVGNAADNST